MLQAERDMEYMRNVERNRRLEALATADDPEWQAGQSVYHRSDAPVTLFLDKSGQVVPK